MRAQIGVSPPPNSIEDLLILSSQDSQWIYPGRPTNNYRAIYSKAINKFRFGERYFCTGTKMHTCVALTVFAVASTMHFGVEAWGGLFNRFSPEMLSNLGYGSHGDYINKNGLYQRPLSGGYGNAYGDSLEEIADVPCDERRCAINEDCCPGSVCINPHEGIGQCVYMFGQKQGELCRRDNDCETGLMCAEVAGSETRSCQPPVTSNKLYNEECNMSVECDISRGLCCQLQRRHRQTPRKICSYFKDPLVCIGPVATDQIKTVVQYTSGEKRITGQGNRIFKRVPFA